MLTLLTSSQSVLSFFLHFDPVPDFDDDDFDDSSASSRSCGEERRAVALYPFHSDSPDTLALQPGQHFVILEEDVEGWTKVRRLDNNLAGDKDVGFVPSSFINVFYSEV